jgi:hypothetical protein
LNINKIYVNEIKKKINYNAVWLPTVKVTPRDIGKISNYQYYPFTTLDNLGISYNSVIEIPQMDFEYSSSNAFTIRVKAAGEAPFVGSVIAKADAGINIRFHKKNAIVFRATKCKIFRIKDLLDLEKQILLRYNKDEWDENMVVVTETVVANGTTIIISNSNNGQIDLKFKKYIGKELEVISIADLNTNFQIIREVNISTNIIASKKLTPLFKIFGIKKKLFKHPRFEIRGNYNKCDYGSLFDEVSYDDF